MKLRIDGREVEAPEKFPLGQVYEAEKYLGCSIAEEGAARIMIALFLAMKQEDPDRHSVDIANDVRNADMAVIEEVEEDPPAPAAEEAAPEDPPNTGTLRSVQSG